MPSCRCRSASCATSFRAPGSASPSASCRRIVGVGAGVGIVAAGPIVDASAGSWLFWLPAGAHRRSLCSARSSASPSRRCARPAASTTRAPPSCRCRSSRSCSRSARARDGAGTRSRPSGCSCSARSHSSLFVLVELRVHEPLIDLRLFKAPRRLDCAPRGTGLRLRDVRHLPARADPPATAAEVTGYGFGKTVSTAGLFLLPTVIAMVICGPLAGFLVRRSGRRFR